MSDTAIEGLEALRTELDALDQLLLQTVHDRIQICLQIGEYKRQHRIPMMQPQRMNVVHDRAQKFGAENGLDAGFLRRLYDTLIAESCRLEDGIIGRPQAG